MKSTLPRGAAAQSPLREREREASTHFRGMTKSIIWEFVGLRVRVPRGAKAGMLGTVLGIRNSRGRHTIELQDGTKRYGLECSWVEKNMLQEDKDKLVHRQEAEDAARRAVWDAGAANRAAARAEEEASFQYWDGHLGSRVRLLTSHKLPASKKSVYAGGSGRYLLIEPGEVGVLRRPPDTMPYGVSSDRIKGKMPRWMGKDVQQEEVLTRRCGYEVELDDGMTVSLGLRPNPGEVEIVEEHAGAGAAGAAGRSKRKR